jgi:hypothetical protein
MIKTQKETSKDHRLVDWRFHFPFLAKKYFLVFSFGQDIRKSQKDIAIEKRHFSPAASLAVGTLFFFIIGISFMIFSIAILYLLKTHLGINVFQDSSPIPDLLKKIRLCH